jgi:hypothetical protein
MGFPELAFKFRSDVGGTKSWREFWYSDSTTFLRGDFTLRAKTKLDGLSGSFYLLFGTFCISVGIYGIYKIFGNI